MLVQASAHVAGHISHLDGQSIPLGRATGEGMLVGRLSAHECMPGS